MKSRPREAASERRTRGQEGPVGDERTRNRRGERRGGEGKQARQQEREKKKRLGKEGAMVIGEQ